MTARAAAAALSSGDRTSPAGRGARSAVISAAVAHAVVGRRHRVWRCGRTARAGEVGRHALAEIALDGVDRAARVDAHEVELSRQYVVLLDQAALVALEGLEDVVAERQVHAGLPVVHALALHDPRQERVDVD